jgi:tripartite-type tricarboxylate transporter receptor subunit TctC
MRIPRRQFLHLAAGAAGLAAAPGMLRADAYPSRPVRLVLPFPPGGVFDIVGRPWADKVSKSGMLGTVFVENQPGAGGSVAAASVAHSAPDGYTIFLGTSSIHLAEMVLREHPLLDPMKDLVTVSMVAITCFGIAVHPSVPAQNLKELIDYVKANPGKLSYGSAGAGTLNHLSGELLKSLTGITDLPHVPYRGAGPALADVIAGQIPIVIPAMTSQVLEFHRTGRLRLLAITKPTRHPAGARLVCSGRRAAADRRADRRGERQCDGGQGLHAIPGRCRGHPGAGLDGGAVQSVHEGRHRALVAAGEGDRRQARLNASLP